VFTLHIFILLKGFHLFFTLHFASLLESVYITVSSFPIQCFRNFFVTIRNFMFCLPFPSSNAVLNVALPHFLICC